MSENVESALALISMVGCLLAAKSPDQPLVMSDQEVLGLQLMLDDVSRKLREGAVRGN